MARTAAAEKHGAPAAVAAAETRDRLAAMAAVAGRIKGYRPAREVLTSVRGVRTIFPQVDAATGIGAWPIQRVALLHGPSNHGKTEFLLGVGKSFLLAGHFFKLVDAERSTPIDWCAQLGLPIDPDRDPRAVGFSSLRPSTYEETVDAVQSWAEEIGRAKAKGELPPDVTGLCVVDSLKKLTPKNLLQKLLKEAAEDEERAPRPGARAKPKRGLDGMGGRGAMFKAALNNQWMDQLVPLCDDCGVAVAIVAREHERQDDDEFLTRDEDYVVGGGRGPFYDSSIRARVVLEGEVWDGEGSSRRTVGQRHRVEIRKTKIAKKTERIPIAYFHSSNGALVPEGFDTPRDLLELAQEMGLVQESGARYRFGRREIGHGRHAAVVRLHKDRELFDAIEREARALIDKRIETERTLRGLL